MCPKATCDLRLWTQRSRAHADQDSPGWGDTHWHSVFWISYIVWWHCEKMQVLQKSGEGGKDVLFAQGLSWTSKSKIPWEKQLDSLENRNEGVAKYFEMMFQAIETGSAHKYPIYSTETSERLLEYALFLDSSYTLYDCKKKWVRRLILHVVCQI